MSITEVARKANVSIATVSRVLNASPLVNAATVRRVQQAMRALKYRPPPVAERRGRKASPGGRLRHKTVALLWTSGRSAAGSLTGMEMLRGAAEALTALKVSLVVGQVGEDGHLPVAVSEGQVDGLLLHGPEPGPELSARLRTFPSVWLLSVGARDWGDRVRPDHAALGESAADTLAEAGCRRVACVSYAPSHGLFYTMRAEGFAHRAAVLGIENIPVGRSLPAQLDAGSRYRAATQVAEELLSLSPRVDGVFVANELGGYLHEQLVRKGARPMKDFVMIAGDRDFCPQHLEPEPILVDVEGAALGRLAVDQLLWRVGHPSAPRGTRLLVSRIEKPRT